MPTTVVLSDSTGRYTVDVDIHCTYMGDQRYTITDINQQRWAVADAFEVQQNKSEANQRTAKATHS